jgi:hypothetical protein
LKKRRNGPSGLHNSPVRILPLCVAPTLRARTPAAARRRPCRARAEDGVARRNESVGLRAAGISGTLGRHYPSARNQPAHLPRRAGSARPVAPAAWSPTDTSRPIPRARRGARRR